MIPFVREMDFAYGRPDTVSPLIRRVVANNPGPFTFRGTGTYLVGRGEVAVIDPGPDDPDHLQALLRALGDDHVTHILVTHDHADHAPLAAELARRMGAPVIGCAPTPGHAAVAPGIEEGRDLAYRPDRVLADGERIEAADWTLRVLATPGHTANHLCFALLQENALFSGDHVMGWSTTVIGPPDGDMTAYYSSLHKVMACGFTALWPTHGPPVTEPEPFLAAYLRHRLAREAQILAALARGPAQVPALVAELYADIDPRLHRAAAASVGAHLIHLMREGAVVGEGGADQVFRLA
jgi:glyoxylase-like metal-dependent hydrolase (beta-lactamase superfamily II)